MIDLGLSVVSVGAATHAGASAIATVMGLRAKLVEPRDSHVVGRDGTPIGVCAAMDLPSEIEGPERIARLAARALDEAIAPTAGAVEIVLIAPPHDRLDDAGLARVIEAVGERARGRTSGEIRVLRGGSAAFAEAIEIAGKRLATSPLVAIGGVHGDLDPAWLAALDRDRRVFGIHQDGGIVPSEGAAFVVLEARSARAMATIARAERASEPAAAEGEPRLAVALTRLVGASVGAGSPPFRWVLTDDRGERDRAREWSLASHRSKGVIGRDARIDTPLLELGDLGAATGPMLAAIAAWGFVSGIAAGPEALLVLRDEGEGRAVVAMRAAPSEDMKGAFRASLEAPRPRSIAGGSSGDLGRDTRRIIETCLAEIGSLADLAQASDDEPWSIAGPFEERMLAAFDALAAHAIGGRPEIAIDIVDRHAASSIVVDRARIFARVFTLASLSEGRDRLPRALADHARYAPTLGRALALSAASIEDLRALLPIVEGDSLAPVLSALAARGEACPAYAVPLLSHPIAEMRAAAAESLGAGGPACAEALAERADVEADEGVLLAIGVALARLGSRRGLDLARTRADAEIEASGTLSDAALRRWLAIVAALGGRDDANRIERLLACGPIAAEAAGYLGDARLVEPLLALLSRLQLGVGQDGDDVIAPAAAVVARALSRLLGRSPMRALDLESGVLIPSSHGNRHRPRAALSTDAEVWKAVAAEAIPLLPKGRVRRGAAFSPQRTIDEINDPKTLLGERRILMFEARVLVPGARVFPDRGYSAEQRRAAEALADAKGATGEYLTAWLR